MFDLPFNESVVPNNIPSYEICPWRKVC